MVRLVLILVYLLSLAIPLMSGIAAITISVAIMTGKADPEDWTMAVLLAAVSFLFWLLCSATKDLTERD
jgi:small neutral amino acid transporter SnatA (MarC family)